MILYTYTVVFSLSNTRCTIIVLLYKPALQYSNLLIMFFDSSNAIILVRNGRKCWNVAKYC